MAGHIFKITGSFVAAFMAALLASGCEAVDTFRGGVELKSKVEFKNQPQQVQPQPSPGEGSGSGSQAEVTNDSGSGSDGGSSDEGGTADLGSGDESGNGSGVVAGDGSGLTGTPADSGSTDAGSGDSATDAPGTGSDDEADVGSPVDSNFEVPPGSLPEGVKLVTTVGNEMFPGAMLRRMALADSILAEGGVVRLGTNPAADLLGPVALTISGPAPVEDQPYDALVAFRIKKPGEMYEYIGFQRAYPGPPNDQGQQTWTFKTEYLGDFQVILVPAGLPLSGDYQEKILSSSHIVAGLFGLPTSPSPLKSFTVTVTGEDLAEYRFHVDAGSTCGSPDDQNPWLAVSSPVIVEVSGTGDRCLAAEVRDVFGYSRSLSETWYHDSDPPAAPAFTAPGDVSYGAPVEIAWDSVPDAVSYNLYIHKGGLKCNADADTEFVDIEPANLSQSLSSPEIGATYHVCLQALDSLGNRSQTTHSFLAAGELRVQLYNLPGSPAVQASVSIEVSGAAEYRYFKGSGFSTSCPSPGSYSVYTGSTTPISLPPLSAGWHLLCVLGREGGAVQATPTEYRWQVQTSNPPTFTFLTPSSGSKGVTAGREFEISWTASDAEEDASISLWYHGSAGGDCDGTLMTSGLREDDTANAYHMWDTSGVPAGEWYICARVDDRVNPPVDVWADHPVRVREPLRLSGPAHDYIKNVTAWNYNHFTVSGGQPPYDWSFLYPPPSGAAITSGGELSYTPSGMLKDYLFHVRVTDADGSTADATVTLHALAGNVCVWTGAGGNTSFISSSNWNRCGNVTPGTSDYIVVPAGTTYQPLLASNKTIKGIGPLPAGYSSGGTLKVNSGVTLTLSDEESTIGSDIVLVGNSATCISCVVRSSSSQDITIYNGATLGLGTGIGLDFYSGTLFVGRFDSSGHLRTTHTSVVPSEWPVLNRTITYYGEVVVGGPQGNPSSVDLNGIKTVMLNNAGQVGISFDGSFNIERFDNVIIGTPGSNALTSTAYVSFDTCPEGTYDTSWSNFSLPAGYLIGFSATSVDVAGCPSLPRTIYISGLPAEMSAGEDRDNDGSGDLIQWGFSPPINDRPSVQILTPSGDGEAMAAGSSFEISFEAADPDDHASISLYYKQAASDGCFGDPEYQGWNPIVSGLAESDSAARYSWTTPNITGKVYFCAVADDGVSDPAYAVGSYPLYLLPGGVVGWLSADHGVATDTEGRIASWESRIPGSALRLTQADGSQRPLLLQQWRNGLPAVSFDGADLLSSPDWDAMAGATAGTVIVVARRSNSAANGAPLLQWGAASAGNLVAIGLGGQSYGDTSKSIVVIANGGLSGGAVSGGSILDPSGIHIAGFTFDGSNAINSNRIELFGNAGPVLSAVIPGTIPGSLTSDSTTLRLGLDEYGVGYAGEIMEILVYNRKLNADEGETVRRYILQRWGERVSTGVMSIASDSDDGTVGDDNDPGTDDLHISGEFGTGEIYMGEYPAGSQYYGFFRFQLPRDLVTGSLIEKASFACHSSGYEHPTGTWNPGMYLWDVGFNAARIWAYKGTDAPVLSSKTQRPGAAGALPVTSTSVRWPESGPLTSFAQVGWQQATDLSPLIEEVLKHNGSMEQSQHLMLWVGSDSVVWDTYEIQCDDYSHPTSDARARFEIEFISP